MPILYNYKRGYLMNILVMNTGSSSLKYQLFDMENQSIIAKGNCDRIGIDGHVKHTPFNGKPVLKENMALPSHSEAINVVIKTLTSEKYGVIDCLGEISAVGHRVVHGGKRFSKSTIITDEVLKAIEDCIPLAPLHIPANLMGIDACKKAIPNAPHVAVFDTAFHLTMPDYAFVYPIPYKYYEQYDIRRYGFHGTSHRYVSERAIEFLGGCSKGLRLISCHLGNGASLAAIKDGKSIDTTMGATPLEGLPMGSRSGTIDPAIVSIISDINGGISVEETMTILNKKSGVLGISELSSDFRDIINAAEHAHVKTKDGTTEVAAHAKLALNVFEYQVAKFIGGYIVALGGIDAIIFTAGVGENSPAIRKGICKWLSAFGIYIDDDKNNSAGGDDGTDITKAGSKAAVLTIPTNEELVIARDTMELVH